MSRRIIISVSNDLSTDQRVLKVADSLYKNGFDVTLIGRKLKNSQPLQLNYPYKRIRLIFNRSFLFYFELNLRLLFALLFSKANIFYANDTDTLPANFVASKIKGSKLVFDAHELFPEVPELQDRPVVQKIWIAIENWIFPHLTTSFTVCNSIAAYYNRKYQIKMHVLRNVPYKQVPSKKRLHFENTKIILYQGALNVGRGLEWVIDAMPYIDHAILYIIGDGDIREQLMQKVKKLDLQTKVIFHGKVPGKELYTYTSSGDIGLCLLENKGLSYYYALPNRVFSYLHAGVPILASPFPEIEQIVKTHHTGVLTQDYQPRNLAKTINEMLEFPQNTDHFKDLKDLFCWEEEEKILLAVMNAC
ncbi:MAG: glycosyltransferase [Paludibacter sp.]|nr:glycosyltransferase [Paludibacter sp.]